MRGRPKDGSYYWLWWKPKAGAKNEWKVGLYVEGAGWQLPGELYSVPPLDYRILRVGHEITREAA